MQEFGDINGRVSRGEDRGLRYADREATCFVFEIGISYDRSCQKIRASVAS